MTSAEEANQQDRVAVSLSGSIVEDVLNHVRAMGASADSMQKHGTIVRREVENLLKRVADSVAFGRTSIKDASQQFHTEVESILARA